MRIPAEQTSLTGLALVMELLSRFLIFMPTLHNTRCKRNTSYSGFELLDPYLMQI